MLLMLKRANFNEEKQHKMILLNSKSLNTGVERGNLVYP
jgi:hypothetical protein